MVYILEQTDLYNGIVNIINKQPVATDYLSLFVYSFGVLISLLSVLDIFLNKNRQGVVKNKKTDWFYTGKEYERNLDERANKNQYNFETIGPLMKFLDGLFSSQ